MWNEPTKKQLDALPGLYDTEDISTDDKIVHMHFFIGGSDWWITEFDGKDLFFGYARLSGMEDFAEWGYMSFRELKDLKVTREIRNSHLELIPMIYEIDHDLHWRPKPFSEIHLSSIAQN